MTTAPGTTGDLPDTPTLPWLLAHNAREYPQLPALSWQSTDPDGTWTTLSWAEVHERTSALAAGFRALGAERGDHVLLMMSNRPEHWLSDLALVRLGAVPVSVYGTAAPEQITHIARNCRARLAVVEGAAQVAVWEPLLADPDSRWSGWWWPRRAPRAATSHTPPCSTSRCRTSSPGNWTPPAPTIR
ncbi:hypothetical protein SHKM778_44130 [Streptomyces sp. KM77-8]|uniref:AMP-dependent synthetase/ligase domain-containing protein n=1 Tax=Streptomyces haneummycinicus TaxID=3074435 RepID=A0AAT9HKS8_9ACTN